MIWYFNIHRSDLGGFTGVFGVFIMVKTCEGLGVLVWTGVCKLILDSHPHEQGFGTFVWMQTWGFPPARQKCVDFIRMDIWRWIWDFHLDGGLGFDFRFTSRCGLLGDFHLDWVRSGILSGAGGLFGIFIRRWD